MCSNTSFKSKTIKEVAEMDAMEHILKPSKENYYRGNLSERDTKAFAFILSEYYKKKIRKKPIDKVIKKKKLIKKSVKEPQIIDNGPTNLFHLTLYLGNLSGFFIFFLIDWVGALIMITASVISIYFFKKFRKYRKSIVIVEKEIEEEVDEVVQGPEYEEILMPTTDKVLSIGRMGIKFKAINFLEDKCIVLGPHEFMGEKKVSYPLISEGKQVSNLITKMENDLSDVPFILEGEKGRYPIQEKTCYGEDVVLRGYEKHYRDALDEMEQLTSDISQIPFPIPWMKVAPFLYLFEVCTRKTWDCSIFESEAHIIETLSHYVNSDNGIPMEMALKNWMDMWSKNHAILHGVRYTSVVNKVAPINLDLSNAIQYSAFNFYCPECNHEVSDEIINRDYSLQQNKKNPPVFFSINSKCMYNPENQRWICPTCETNTSAPIPIHKTLDEVLMPTFDKLMDENKNERLKIHDNFCTREIDNTNEMEKEIESGFYEHLNHIYSLTDEMERLKAEIMGENEAVKSILEVAEAYNYRQSKVMDIIHDDCERINAEIIEKTNNVVADMDSYKEEQMGLLAQELQHLSKVKRVEDEKRDAVQRKILQTNREINETVKTGFKETVNAIHQQTDVLSTKIDHQTDTLAQKIDHQTNSLGQKIDNQTNVLGKKIDKGNAIQAAVAKKQGIDTKDYSFWRLDKKINYLKEEVIGGITGRSTEDTEMAKMKND
jgi:hypothetical protein